MASPKKPEEAKKKVNTLTRNMVERLAATLITVADAYLLVMLSWAEYQRIDLSSFVALTAFQKRVGKRRAVQKALKEEGLA